VSRHRRSATLTFSRRELFDLAAAWLVLSLAFAILFGGGGLRFLATDPVVFLGVSLLTAGVAFLLHELAHKIVSVRFGQLAEFRADYNMLFLALMAAFVGFIFAAPGAVHHRGRITKREQGLIALAGPVTNLGLAALFLPFAPAFLPAAVVSDGFLAAVGDYGVLINVLLAGFNMIPFGPLDGRKVLDWNPIVFAVVFVPSLLLAVAVFVPGLLLF
jgi:Zn-dependent protease